MPSLIALHVVIVPGGQRVDLDDAARQVFVGDPNVRARRRIGASKAGDPGRLAGKRSIEWLHFAGRTACVGVVTPDITVRAGQRVDGSKVQVEATTQIVGEPLGLGKQVAGVQQHDVDIGDGAGHEVHQGGVAKAGGHHQTATEASVGPAENLGWVV